MGLRSLLKKFQANRDFLAMRPEDLVTSAYRALLQRDPDPSNLRHLYGRAPKRARSIVAPPEPGPNAMNLC